MSDKKTLFLPSFTRRIASKPRRIGQVENSYEPMRFKENMHLVWVAETLKKTLPKSRTHRLFEIKFNKSLKELETLGQDAEVTSEVLCACGIIMPEVNE